MSQPLQLAITLDVEEEGLFSGRYARLPHGVTNVAELKRLEFIPREFGFPLTLLVTYPVARDPAARELLAYWQEEYGAEIGAHLHPWNTPPFWDLPHQEPIPSNRLPLALLGAKLGALVATLEEAFGTAPRSFRMGRFDWTPALLELLPRFGLRVDSSMVPLSQKVGGPPHFLAPPDPFWLSSPGSSGEPLLEMPLTTVPVWAGASRGVHRFSSLLPVKLGETLLSWFRFVGAAGIHPAWFPQVSMRLAAFLHRRRGGGVFTMFLHSSELLPGGGNPNFSTAQAVDRLVVKLRAFLAWLVKTGPVSGVTMSGLYESLVQNRPATPGWNPPELPAPSNLRPFWCRR